MDWTQIILAVIALVGTAITVIVPIMLTRTHKKTRGLASEENKTILDRIGGMETSMAEMRTEVKDLRAETKSTDIRTQGLYLLDVIEHRPLQTETIRTAFTAYSTAGGNGHVEKVYRQWEASFGEHLDRGEVPPSMKDKTA